MTSPSRRDLFRAAGAVGAAGALGAAGVAVSAAPAAAAPKPGSAFLPSDQNTHLLRRATFGPTPDTLAALRKQGRAKWLAQQLDPQSIDDSACTDFIRTRFPHLSWTMPEAKRKVGADKWEYMISLSMATIGRAVWSKRQLFEVMCEFWSNHLNVTAPAGKGIYFSRSDYDRNVIRKHALGRFEDLLTASAQHPAMLIYLNNDESTKLAPNENYGRELLELHTVGVDGGYNEADMANSALIMTGFGFDKSSGLFKYHPADHYTGPVAVMGFSDPNASDVGGHDVGLSYVKYLAHHPSTAQHLAYKLCVRFISDTPDPAFVSELASVYLANDTAIAPVLQHLFSSATFASSIGQKTRRPFEDVVATLRILGYQPERKGVTGMRALYFVCNEVGQPPFGWPQPNGYPDDAVSWASAGTTMNRWNRHLALAAHWWPTQLRQPDLRTLLPKRLPRTHGALVDDLAKRLVFRSLAAEHEKVVLHFLGRRATDPLDRNSPALGWKLPSVVALILDSPYHGMR
ncbi:MAG: DUF1800 domain-containing protein [Actinomycetes bacterium]